MSVRTAPVNLSKSLEGQVACLCRKKFTPVKYIKLSYAEDFSINFSQIVYFFSKLV